MRDEEVIWENQHTFNKGRTCLTHWMAFCDGRITLLDTGRTAGVVYLDLRKASDMVPHHVFISKLEKYVFEDYSKILENKVNYFYCIRVFIVYSRNLQPVSFHYLKKFLRNKFCTRNLASGWLRSSLFTFFADSEKRTPLFPIIPTG